MKIKRVAFIFVVMIAILMVASIFNASYAATEKYFTIKQIRASGYGYKALEKNIWKITETSSNGTDLMQNDTIYCLRGGPGFGGAFSGTGNPQATKYTQSFNMKNPSSITGAYASVIPTPGSTRYNSLIWLLNNIYVAPKKNASTEEINMAKEYREYLLDKVGIGYNEITDDEIDVVQQLAVWYFTNTDGYKVPSDTLSFSILVNSVINDANSTYIDLDWDELTNCQDLFAYLVTEAEANSSYNPSTTTATKPYELGNTTKTIATSGNNYMIGPFRINKVSGTEGTLIAKMKNGSQEITNLSLVSADGRNTYTSLDETVGKDFYLVLPTSTNLEDITLEISGSYFNTTITYWSVLNAPTTEQPIVKVERTRETYSESTTYTPEKKLDFALRKFITMVGSERVTNRVPQISSQTLNALKNGTITTAEKTHTKDPLTVKTGDRVVYTIRVYNEGEVEGYVTEITDYIPDGLKFLPNDNTNINYRWTISADGKTAKTIMTSATNINAFNGTDLKYLDVEIACEVTATAGDTSKILKNVAEITGQKDRNGNTKDVDSTPNNLTTAQKQNYNPGTSTRGWGYEDDDDYEDVILLPEDKKFDLALRKYIATVNSKTPAISREPKISAETIKDLKDGKITTAQKVHTKNPLVVKTGDKVIYAIRVYNEGEVDGYVTEITDYLPEGLKYLPDSETNKANKWTVSSDGKTIKTSLLSATPLQAFNGSEIKYYEVRVECEVIATVTEGSKTLRNIAEITAHKDKDNNTSVNDIDSTPDNVIRTNYTTSQEDDDDYEDLIIVSEKFDLALRKFIKSINGTAPAISREPKISAETIKDLKDGKITTAQKVHPKNALLVKTGDKIIYTIRVYNEGEVDGYVTEVTDYLPNGLKFVENSTLNNSNGWTVSADGKTIKTSKLSGTLLKAFDGSNLQYLDVQIECEVTATVSDSDKTLRNIAEITAHKDKNNDTTVKDIDSDPNNVITTNYTTNQEDDDDYELVVLQGKYFDLALRKFITAVNDKELTSRIPKVDVSPLIEGKTTAIYKHPKVPVNVNAGDIVIYTLRIYNEGEVDGYADEITDYLPQWLEFINDEFNAKYGWKVSADGRKVTTTITSKNTEYAASRDVIYADRTNNSDKVLIKAFDKDTKTLDYIDIQIKCKVKDTGLATKITNIAEITKASNSDGEETVDRDSVPNNITLPTDSSLPNYKDDEISRGEEYIPGQEDDDDFEKVIIQKFDLALRKFITAVNNTEVTNRVPVFSIDEDGKYVYTHTKTPVEVSNKDIVTYTLRVYNEGNVDGFASEVKDNVPEGLEFLPDNEINKEYRWKMYKEDGTETTNASEAKTIRTDYLSKEQQDATNRTNIIKAFDKENMTQPDYKDLKVAFKVIEPNTSDRVIINIAEISKDKNKENEEVDDIDSTPDNDKEDEDDIDIEKVKVKYFDLALEKIVTEYSIKLNGKTTVTKTNHKFGVQPEPVVKIELVNNYIKASIIKFKYQIKVTNEGEIEGYADEIKDYIPEGLKFVAEDNPKWKLSEDGKTVTTDQLNGTLLKPGESAIVEITLQWINGQNNLGLKQNWAEISKDRNESESPDIDSTPDNYKKDEDDIDDASVILSVKTGSGEDYIIIAGGVLAILSTGIVLIKKFVI